MDQSHYNLFEPTISYSIFDQHFFKLPKFVLNSSHNQSIVSLSSNSYGPLIMKNRVKVLVSAVKIQRRSITGISADSKSNSYNSSIQHCEFDVRTIISMS